MFSAMKMDSPVFRLKTSIAFPPSGNRAHATGLFRGFFPPHYSGILPMNQQTHLSQH